jgi:hypothetical protein
MNEQMRDFEGISERQRREENELAEERAKDSFLLNALGLSVVITAGMLAHLKDGPVEINPDHLPQPGTEAQIASYNPEENTVILSQGEKKITVPADTLDQEVMNRITASNPELKKFLDNGPFTVINPDKPDTYQF